jgi:hypothetical protein
VKRIAMTVMVLAVVGCASVGAPESEGAASTSEEREEDVGSAESEIGGTRSMFLDGLCDNHAMPATQRNLGSVWMHSCPEGSAMVGAHFGSNEFVCAPVPWQESGCYEDATGLNRAGMRACPKGKYMRGYHQGQNKMICCNFPQGELDGEFVDTSSQWYFDNLHWSNNQCTSGEAHICPTTWSNGWSVMTGVHVGNNQFLCGY